MSLDDSVLAADAQQDFSKLKPFRDMPGPKGLPLVGTLWQYLKKDGLKFSKMFEVKLYLCIINPFPCGLSIVYLDAYTTYFTPYIDMTFRIKLWNLDICIKVADAS